MNKDHREWRIGNGEMTNMSNEEKFWNWFLQHEPELIDFEGDQEAVFDKLAAELQKIDPNLTFEFGPNGTPREFVISAAGIKDAFPAVVALVQAVPNLDRWKVIAFRPRRSPINTVEFRGKSVKADEVQFTLLDNGKIAGIYLFIPGFRDTDTDLKQIGYLLLDEALGEFDVETRLGLIKMLSPNERIDGKRYRLPELAFLFDGLVARLEGRSREPS